VSLQGVGSLIEANLIGPRNMRRTCLKDRRSCCLQRQADLGRTLLTVCLQDNKKFRVVEGVTGANLDLAASS
jgi:hypothetical protein